MILPLIKNILFVLILSLGLLTSYSDIKIGKIKNKTILIHITLGLVIHLFLFSYLLYVKELNYSYALTYFSNLLLSVIVGYGLWHSKIWSAGDGKLFIVYSSIIPLSIYQKQNISGFPSLILLLNIFICGLIYLIILIFLKENKKTLFIIFKKTGRDFFKIKSLLNTTLSLLIITIALTFLFTKLNMKQNYLLSLILMFILNKPLEKIKLTYLLPTTTIFLVISFLYFHLNLTIKFWLTFLISLVVYRIGRNLVFNYLKELSLTLFSKEISIYELKEGMILADTFTKKKRLTNIEFKQLKEKGTEILKPNKTYYLRDKKTTHYDKSIFITETEGLTKKEIKKIQSLKGTTIRIQTTIPFAAIIFIGVILTILARGIFLYF